MNLQLLEFLLRKIELNTEKKYNLDVRKTMLKDDVDVRIESLKTVLEKLREDLHSKIGRKFLEIR